MSSALRDATDENDFSARAEALLECTDKIMSLYIPGANRKIQMLVGRNTTAEIQFGGPITQEAIMDVMAHLSFYKKYFPKTTEDLTCTTPDRIIGHLRAILAEDRAEREIIPDQIENKPEQ
jgi:hypothetical protein